MRITPPEISAPFLYLEPNMLPTKSPTQESAKVIVPINPTAGRIETSRKANVTPTASASMLVATARRYHRLEIERRAFLFLLAERLTKHIYAYDKEKSEGYPMVEIRYEVLETASEKIADKRHNRLKNAEVKSHAKSVLPFDTAYRKPFTDRHRKSVHRKSDGNKKEFGKSHMISPYRTRRYICNRFFKGKHAH